MHNIFLFARREYLETVRKKSFIVMTILLPAMMFGFTILPSMIASKKSSEVQHVVIATADAQFGEEVSNRFLNPDEQRNPLKRDDEGPARNFDVQVDANVSPQEEETLTQKVNSHQLDGYLWAPPDALAERKLTYRSRTSSDFETQGTLSSAVRQALLRQEFRNHGATSEEISNALKPVDVETRKVENGKVTDSGGVGIFFTALLLMILLYTTLIIYGMSVMRSVLEEKNSRIFEVLLSAATPKQLMAGKILGAGAVGLTQIGIWGLFAVTLGAGSLISMGGMKFHLSLTPMNMIFFGLFFILGFLLYASVGAAVGSAVNSEQEAQQFQMLVLMPLIISMIFMMPVIQQPHSTLATVLSLIPFCTPLLMYIRIVVETPPAWQIALSLVLLLGTIYAMLSICSRIYRVGILMYGKRPTLPEIVKWMKYA